MNNKGFTLIELIVASLVGTIVVLCIVTYGMIGINQFRASRAETMAQNETEIVIMALKDKLKTAKDYKVYNKDDLTIFEILYGDDYNNNYTTYDCAFIYSSNNTDIYIINNGRKDEMQIDIDSIDIESLKVSGIVSRYITGFEVYPNKINDCDNGIVNIKVRASVSNYDYSQSLDIMIRNSRG